MLFNVAHEYVKFTDDEMADSLLSYCIKPTT